MKKVMLDIDGHIVEVAITRPDYAKQGRAPHLVLTATCGSTVLETPIPVKLRGNRARGAPRAPTRRSGDVKRPFQIPLRSQGANVLIRVYLCSESR
jgi:hypothetical protein